MKEKRDISIENTLSSARRPLLNAEYLTLLEPFPTLLRFIDCDIFVFYLGRWPNAKHAGHSHCGFHWLKISPLML
jgi:hypothetical protein